MPDLSLVETLKRGFAAALPDAVCAYLFGSRARGTARATSDVDVGVLLRPEAAAADPLGRHVGGEIVAATRTSTARSCARSSSSG